ncbi:GLPGLI family protein [Chishuiella sp.]|uniref:GLPGLI family protein n=1 Tax=Chishuiella sp. TaxID=1969467 RepID=UPI0028AA35EC|nr:GLPGLI family protein [Chishuiella sp.]
MKKLLFFLLLSVFGYSQKISGDIKYKSEKSEIEKLDISSKNIYYKYIFSFDKENKDKKRSTITVLQVGKNISKFTDVNLLKYDSLFDIKNQNEFIYTNDLNELIPISRAIKFKKLIIKNNDKYTFQGNVYNNNYEFIEVLPIFKWQLQSGKKVILGYNCKEAILNYAGRKWIAYYTDDIPLNDGPFLFNGLPGLILEIFDDKKEHYFVAEAIDNIPNSIYIHKERKIIKTSRKEFYKAEMNFHKNPELYVEKVYSSPGVEDTSFIHKELPYNPIELE